MRCIRPRELLTAVLTFSSICSTPSPPPSGSTSKFDFRLLPCNCDVLPYSAQRRRSTREHRCREWGRFRRASSGFSLLVETSSFSLYFSEQVRRMRLVLQQQSGTKQQRLLRPSQRDSSQRTACRFPLFRRLGLQAQSVESCCKLSLEGVVDETVSLDHALRG